MRQSPPALTLIHNTSLPDAWTLWLRQASPEDAAPPELQAGPSLPALAQFIEWLGQARSGG